jgi:cytochrome b subunit of formate dehydrogenase
MLVVAASAFGKDKASASPADKTAECLACHSDASLAKDVNGKAVSLHVDEGKFKASIHGSMFGCTDCHKDFKDFPHENTAKVDCATCHAGEVENYKASVHGKAMAAGNTQAATCLSCHGTPHEIVVAGEPTSPVAHQNIPKTCGSCHGQKFVMESNGHSAAPYFSYQESVHGKAVAAGSDKAAVCTDCHGSHEIMTAADPKSSIFKFNVPNTCAKCHDKVKVEFMSSIHGKAITKGVSAAPVCTDCHGIHGIKSHVDPTSSVSAQNLAGTTCAKCHESVRLSEDYGVAGGRASTYMASYHGLALKMGSKTAANCASCHDVHNILPSSDPQSTISQANLAKTCGQCHPGAGDNFIKGKVHIEAPLSADIGSISVSWVRRIYVGMIGGTIGFMVLHNFLIWRKKATAKRKDPRRIVVRMESEQRMQHLLLLTSFIVLVITGFALKYPESIFARALLINEQARSIIHRIAGSLLVLVSVYHVFYLAAKRSGRQMLFDMLPMPKDATDVLSNLRYYLGLGGNPARFSRFTYGEKMEYWALVWGTFVMATTGFMLWFKVGVGNLVPRWWLDVATAIHFYEAILATLAIAVWHFYQVIFDPDIYPMNWAWWDGKMSVETYSHEHADDQKTIAEAIAKRSETNADESPADDKVDTIGAGHHD